MPMMEVRADDRPHVVRIPDAQIRVEPGGNSSLSVGQAVGFTTLYVVIGTLCLGAVARFRWLARPA